MTVKGIKIVVDTDSLTQQDVGPNVYMLGPSNLSPSDQGGDELGITVNNGDQVIWSAVGFKPDVKIRLKAAETPGALTTNMNTTYNDDGTVTAEATTQGDRVIYRFSFVVDDVDYTSYTWDPYITIT